MQKIIDVQHVTKAYVDGKRKTGALSDVSFSLPQGESMAIIGPSGSGKTTLLHVLGGLEKPTNGDVEVDGKKITNTGENQLSQFRNSSRSDLLRPDSPTISPQAVHRSRRSLTSVSIVV